MVRSVARNLPEQVKNNQSVNTAAGNGGQKMSQYSWFTVYAKTGALICLKIFENFKNDMMITRKEEHSRKIISSKKFATPLCVKRRSNIVTARFQLW